jgi:rhodanese-related sulfurtransferase
MIRLLPIITALSIISIGSPANYSVAETAPFSSIPAELIARKLKKHDASLAISVEEVLNKIRQNQNITLVDVRSSEDFERLHIPGSINIRLFALKTKTHLKTAPLVLVNEGLRYTELENECRRLLKWGFQVSILDGGLPAWKRKGGQLAGDMLSLETMKIVAPQVFFREKNYENTLAVDISPIRSKASAEILPYALHLPVLNGSDALRAKLKRLLSDNKPFQSIVVFDETGEQYEKAGRILSEMGTEAFYLDGGVVGYQKYLEGLVLSLKPRDSRLKTVGNCSPCGNGNDVGEQ